MVLNHWFNEVQNWNIIQEFGPHVKCSITSPNHEVNRFIFLLSETKKFLAPRNFDKILLK